MSDSKTENEEGRRGFEESLKEMPEHLRLFSLGMRSLYSNQNSGTSSDVSRKFTKLRDDTRQDAKVYLKVVFPLTIKFVCAIKDFFEYCAALSYEEWCASLPNILENVKANKDLVEMLLKMYEEIIVPLKKREDEAKNIMAELKDLETAYKNATRELEAKAETKRNWAYALAFIPLVNVIATPLLQSYANEDSVRAITTIQESKIHEAAALVVAETLMPALVNFINGLSKAAGFFENMEIKMKSYQEFGKEVNDTHFKILKNKVETINPSCNEFYAALPAIRTDFQAIPDGDNQQEYVEKWLEKMLEYIEKKRKSTQKHFWDVVQGIQGISLKPIMQSSSSNTADMSSSEQA